MTQIDGTLVDMSSQFQATVEALTRKVQVHDATVSRVESCLESLCRGGYDRSAQIRFEEQDVENLADQVVLRLAAKPGLAQTLESEGREYPSRVNARQQGPRRYEKARCTCAATTSTSRISWPPI